MKHLLLSLGQNILDITVALTVVLITAAFVIVPTYLVMGLFK